MDNIKWFKEAKYGLMIHFGLYSMLGGTYHGRPSSHYAEWIQSHQQIPNAEMERMAHAFNPIYFDAEEWVRFAAECGMKYFVITSKHHDGFALFKSEADPFNICDATPFGRDIIGELAAACKKYGLKLGLYYSQDLDWHEEHGGGYLSDPRGCAGASWDNSWDFPDASKKHYDIVFEKKILPQIKEIMTKYGEICLVWFDVPMTVSAEQSRKIYEVVKEAQPDCLVNSRLGNGAYDYVSLGDNEIPREMPETVSGDVDYNDICGFKPSPYGLYESACTLNDSWGYASLDNNWKSPEVIYENKKRLNAMGINYLINIGPDHLGRFPLQAIRILRRVKELEDAETK
ncbi:MAG: alpha-L-fucosidase [Clostridia bacterium]|nr:alpha-L-fucosidase [Clostridia bacterium]